MFSSLTLRGDLCLCLSASLLVSPVSSLGRWGWVCSLSGWSTLPQLRHGSGTLGTLSEQGSSLTRALRVTLRS